MFSKEVNFKLPACTVCHVAKLFIEFLALVSLEFKDVIAISFVTYFSDINNNVVLGLRLHLIGTC